MMYVLLVLIASIAYFVVMHRPRLDRTEEGSLLLWFYNKYYERTFIILIKNKK